MRSKALTLKKSNAIRAKSVIIKEAIQFDALQTQELLSKQHKKCIRELELLLDGVDVHAKDKLKAIELIFRHSVPTAPKPVEIEINASNDFLEYLERTNKIKKQIEELKVKQAEISNGSKTAREVQVVQEVSYQEAGEEWTLVSASELQDMPASGGEGQEEV